MKEKREERKKWRGERRREREIEEGWRKRVRRRSQNGTISEVGLTCSSSARASPWC